MESESRPTGPAPRCFASAVMALAILAENRLASAQVDVLTQHNDSARSVRTHRDAAEAIERQHKRSEARLPDRGRQRLRSTSVVSSAHRRRPARRMWPLSRTGKQRLCLRRGRQNQASTTAELWHTVQATWAHASRARMSATQSAGTAAVRTTTEVGITTHGEPSHQDDGTERGIVFVVGSRRARQSCLPALCSQLAMANDSARV